MVTVPAGTFRLGENQEPVDVPAFFIDRTEVTNREYRQFSTETNRALPADFPQASPDLPVVNITFSDAQAFAKWAGKRLPTGREWEKAARGTDGRLFPWGNDKDLARANVGTKKIGAADGMPGGASIYGALQMVGNVWEWTAEPATPTVDALNYFSNRLTPKPATDEPWYQIRGLSFSDALVDGAVWDYFSVPARWKDANIGFRCVRDAK
jgi:formylglycine-generating enzyme required for sulfatase activity